MLTGYFIYYFSTSQIGSIMMYLNVVLTYPQSVYIFWYSLNSCLYFVDASTFYDLTYCTIKCHARGACI